MTTCAKCPTTESSQWFLNKDPAIPGEKICKACYNRAQVRARQFDPRVLHPPRLTAYLFLAQVGDGYVCPGCKSTVRLGLVQRQGPPGLPRRAAGAEGCQNLSKVQCEGGEHSCLVSCPTPPLTLFSLPAPVHGRAVRQVREQSSHQVAKVQAPDERRHGRAPLHVRQVLQGRGDRPPEFVSFHRFPRL